MSSESLPPLEGFGPLPSLSRSTLDVVGFGELIAESPLVSPLGRLGKEAEGKPGEELGIELEEPELPEELELLGLFWELELEELLCCEEG